MSPHTGEQLTVLRQRLRVVGAKNAAVLAFSSEPAACQAIIDQEVHDALEELSREGSPLELAPPGAAGQTSPDGSRGLKQHLAHTQATAKSKGGRPTNIERMAKMNGDNWADEA